jgi:hypothetical protein
VRRRRRSWQCSTAAVAIAAVADGAGGAHAALVVAAILLQTALTCSPWVILRAMLLSWLCCLLIAVVLHASPWRRRCCSAVGEYEAVV